MPPIDRSPTPTRLDLRRRLRLLRLLRRPKRPTLGLDLGVGVLLLLALGVTYLLRMFAFGMEAWAGQGADGAVDRLARARLDFTWHLLCLALGLAGVAALLRARWTAAIQVLVALALSASVLLMQHDWDRRHPAPPAPLPSGYVPCYSGSGRCN
ncbi:DUF6234 family protein [Kitasatospora sp. NPDC028055]|uniref:DUF6234 family protein n=1 Tax=Kitasatospora sp. NPDC028055 TaxID=3155653 RepID=UPI003401AF04